MTDTPKPVKAWGIIENGKIFDLEFDEDAAKDAVKMFYGSGMTVIPVLITPIGEDHD